MVVGAIVVVLVDVDDVVLVVGGRQGPFGITIIVPGTVRGLSVTTQIFVSPGYSIIASGSCVVQSVIIIATGISPILVNEKFSQGCIVVVLVVVGTAVVEVVVVIVVVASSNNSNSNFDLYIYNFF